MPSSALSARKHGGHIEIRPVIIYSAPGGTLASILVDSIHGALASVCSLVSSKATYHQQPRLGGRALRRTPLLSTQCPSSGQSYLHAQSRIQGIITTSKCGGFLPHMRTSFAHAILPAPALGGPTPAQMTNYTKSNGGKVHLTLSISIPWIPF